MSKNNVKINTRKRILFLLVVSLLLLVALIGRTAWIQIVDSEWLQQKAYESQTRDRTISSKRGTIYSSDNAILAKSYSVETVKVIPAQVTNQAQMAQKLADILELTYEEVYEKICKNVSEVVIKNNVDKEKTDEIRQWIIESKSKGIKIDESIIPPTKKNKIDWINTIGTIAKAYAKINSYDLAFDT